MAEHGGYRKPANPAPVSGPGAHSRRTDGGPAQVISAAPDQGYGEMSDQMNQQRTAPMGGQTPLPTPPQAAPAAGPGNAQPASNYAGGAFNAPSARPGEPVTAGAPIGPGPGPEALSSNVVMPNRGTGAMTDLLQRLSATDTTGILGQLMQAAQARGA